jgi:hypothetical protein
VEFLITPLLKLQASMSQDTQSVLADVLEAYSFASSTGGDNRLVRPIPSKLYSGKLQLKDVVKTGGMLMSGLASIDRIAVKLGTIADLPPDSDFFNFWGGMKEDPSYLLEGVVVADGSLITDRTFVEMVDSLARKLKDAVPLDSGQSSNVSLHDTESADRRTDASLLPDLVEEFGSLLRFADNAARPRWMYSQNTALFLASVIKLTRSATAEELSMVAAEIQSLISQIKKNPSRS